MERVGEIPGTRMQGAVFDPARRANETWKMGRKELDGYTLQARWSHSVRRTNVCLTTVMVSTWILENARLCEYVSVKASVSTIAQAGEGDLALSRASGHRRWFCIATVNGIICMHSFFTSHQSGLYPDQANRSCDDKHMYAAKLGRTLLLFCHSSRVALNRWRAGWP